LAPVGSNCCLCPFSVPYCHQFTGAGGGRYYLAHKSRFIRKLNKRKFKKNYKYYDTFHSRLKYVILVNFGVRIFWEAKFPDTRYYFSCSHIYTPKTDPDFSSLGNRYATNILKRSKQNSILCSSID